MRQEKVYFCTFADSRFQPTLNRITKEAVASKFFDNYFIFNEFNLNSKFKKRFKGKLLYSNPGFGYWIWKPVIIEDALMKLNENDLLLYLDAGCSININGKNKFEEYLKLAKESACGIVAVELDENHTESAFTKGDLFDYFNVRTSEQIYNTPQVQAGIIFLKKTENTLEFVKKWKQVFEDNFSLINDDASVAENFKNFISHKHDQSIFSILFKLFKGKTIPLSDVWVANKNDLALLSKSPILALRRKNSKFIGLIFMISNLIKSKF